MSREALLDLVCGPASPLPETYQRYRLVAHLGSGGQADVFRAVRLCGGVSSAPMTVKVFRLDARRPLADELRSWDKGDAALMDLNNRGVAGICRRADGFYGPPPHRPGERTNAGEAVPYQIYDYLHGVNLREYIKERADLGGGGRRLNGVSALRTLAGVLRALHHPQEAGATPVLHMDVKPSNVMVLTSGDVRLIDFTGARYWREEEITQIAYTPESGGPEAFGGVKYVGPAYDVHGFGAVAYYLVTGAYPRVDASQSGRSGPGEASPPPWSVLRRHPMLENMPGLRDHLHAVLADRPSERPGTLELSSWLGQLAELVRRARVPDVGVDWAEPDKAEAARAVGRATPRPAVTGTETDAFQRIERLERELVELRAVAGPGLLPVSGPGLAPVSGAGLVPVSFPPMVSGAPVGVGAALQTPTLVGAVSGPPTMVGGPPTAVAGSPMGPPAAGRPQVGGPTAAHPQVGTGPAGGGAPAQIRGRAKVAPPKPPPDPTGMIDPVDPGRDDLWDTPTRDSLRALKLGWELSGTGALIAFICWGIWAASSGGRLIGPLITFFVVLMVATGVFFLSRLIGKLVLEQRMGRTRHTAKGSHALTGLFLMGAGLTYLQQTPWVVDFVTWLRDSLW